VNIQPVHVQDYNRLKELSLQMAPWTKNKIVFHSIASKGIERFELFSKNNQLNIYAISASRAAGDSIIT